MQSGPNEKKKKVKKERNIKLLFHLTVGLPGIRCATGQL